MILIKKVFSYKKSKSDRHNYYLTIPVLKLLKVFLIQSIVVYFIIESLIKKTYSFFHHNLRIVLRKPLALYQERLLYKVIYPHYCKIFYRAYLCVYRGKINREIFNLCAKRSMRNLAMRNYKMRYFTLLMSYFTVIKRHG